MKNLRLIGGKIFGGTGWNVPKWGKSILIRDGIIASVDCNDVFDASCETISLNDALVLPGLCDAHMHLVVGGLSLRIPDLEGLDEPGVIDSLKNYIKSENTSSHGWVKAFNWQPWRCTLDAKSLDRAI
ncbi:MAG: hypothetical protein HQ568_11505, partial [Calditrichaeota bacterium]|nr:hypothetical protein [Calditrichota bacterium]